MLQSPSILNFSMEMAAQQNEDDSVPCYPSHMRNSRYICTLEWKKETKVQPKIHHTQNCLYLP